MTNTKTCAIKLLNKTYHVKCPESEEQNLLLAVEKLNEQIAKNKSKFKLLDNFQTLLLAALDISHELVACRNEQEQQREQVSQFIASLESKTTKTLSDELHASAKRSE